MRDELHSSLPDTPLPASAFDTDDELLWVMHCAEGPVPRAAAAAIRALLAKETAPWEMRWEEDFVGLPLRLKEQGALLLGGRPEDFSLTATTTSALALVAQGLPWESGDEVLVPLGEFPANAWPWMALKNRGVSFREVPLWRGHGAGQQAFWPNAIGKLRSRSTSYRYPQ